MMQVGGIAAGRDRRGADTNTHGSGDRMDDKTERQRTLALLAVFLRGALRRYESGEWNGAGNGLQIAEGLCRRLVEIDAREEAADGDAR